MTGEGKKPTEKWVEAKGPDYPYAYDRTGGLSSWFGIRGIPHAVLIDPAGTVVWRGHPSQLKKKMIQPHLEGALARPVFEWPEALQPAREALAAGRLGDALTKAGSDAEVQRSIRGLIAKRVGAFEATLKRKDYLRALELAEDLATQLEGLPEGDQVAKLRATISGESVEAVLGAQRRVRELVSGKIKAADVDRIAEELLRIRDQHKGTGAADDAKRAFEALMANRRRR